MKNHNGIIFDDVTKNDGAEWSQICNSCLDKHTKNIDTAYVSDCGSGICGVLGCSNESDCYIDFKEEKLTGPIVKNDFIYEFKRVFESSDIQDWTKSLCEFLLDHFEVPTYWNFKAPFYGVTDSECYEYTFIRDIFFGEGENKDQLLKFSRFLNKYSNLLALTGRI